MDSDSLAANHAGRSVRTFLGDCGHRGVVRQRMTTSVCRIQKQAGHARGGGCWGDLSLWTNSRIAGGDGPARRGTLSGRPHWAGLSCYWQKAVNLRGPGTTSLVPRRLSGAWITVVADIYSKFERSEIMARVRNKGTTPEETVGTFLRELGLRYRRNDRGLPGQPDFSIRSRKTAIFVNGCFWHGHANCPRAKLPQTNALFWATKIQMNKRRDRRVARTLRQQGWRVLTIWQCRLRKPDRVRTRLARQLGPKRGRIV